MMKTRFATLALAAFAMTAVAMPLSVKAQEPTDDTATAVSIESIGDAIGLGNADLKKTVLNILQLVLGLLALVAVVMVIWGGFTWLTSGGNEDKVDQAKKIISAAVIGLIIVLLAWAVVIFVTRTTSNVTNDGTEDVVTP